MPRHKNSILFRFNQWRLNDYSISFNCIYLINLYFEIVCFKMLFELICNTKILGISISFKNWNILFTWKKISVRFANNELINCRSFGHDQPISFRYIETLIPLESSFKRQHDGAAKLLIALIATLIDSAVEVVAKGRSKLPKVLVWNLNGFVSLVEVQCHVFLYLADKMTNTENFPYRTTNACLATF